MGCTIKDIARDTGLSLATISKYLNGKRLSAANEEKVRESIERLGYVPNKSAQNLRSRRAHAVCILMSELGDPFWGGICNHIEAYLQKKGYYTIISSFDNSRADQTKLYLRILSSQVDGVIIIPYKLENTNLLQLLQQGSMPFVLVDQLVAGVAVDAVTSANFQSSYDITKSLIHRGHRRLGLIGRGPDSYTTLERIRGFQEACGHEGVPADDQRIEVGTSRLAVAARIFRDMVMSPSPPTAVYILGYDLTISAIQQVQELGIKIPEDISLVTFDDNEIFAAFDPPITAIVQDLEQIGRRAARLLLKRIRGEWDDFPQTVFVPTTLVERSSVK